MSVPSISFNKEGILEFSLNGSIIILTELRIRSMSNWKTPHQILGRGGASIALTNEQMVHAVGEFLRITLSDPVHVAVKHVGWLFECKKGVQP